MTAALIILAVLVLLGLLARYVFARVEPDPRLKNQEFKQRQAEGRVRSDEWRGKGDRL
jgi:hypothetical protein